MLTVKAIAQQIGVSLSLVYDWCKSGALKCSRYGGHKGKRGAIRVLETDLTDFLARCQQEGQEALPPLKHIKMSPS